MRRKKPHDPLEVIDHFAIYLDDKTGLNSIGRHVKILQGPHAGGTSLSSGDDEGDREDLIAWLVANPAPLEGLCALADEARAALPPVRHGVPAPTKEDHEQRQRVIDLVEVILADVGNEPVAVSATVKDLQLRVCHERLSTFLRQHQPSD